MVKTTARDSDAMFAANILLRENQKIHALLNPEVILIGGGADALNEVARLQPAGT